MKRAVIDTSVVVSAFIGEANAAPGRVVAAWRERRFTMIVSPLLLTEFGEVLERDRFEHRASGGRGAAYVAAFAARGERYEDVEDAGGHVSDPDDDFIVTLCRTAAADVIVSLDRHLLDAALDDVVVMKPDRFLEWLDE